MKTKSYEWWEDVQLEFHKNFDNVRLSAEHILWLSEKFDPAKLNKHNVSNNKVAVCEHKSTPRLVKEAVYECPDCKMIWR